MNEIPSGFRKVGTINAGPTINPKPLIKEEEEAGFTVIPYGDNPKMFHILEDIT